MMTPMLPGEIVFDDEPKIVPNLIKIPKKKRKQKGWWSYYNWWLQQQYFEIWLAGNDSEFPFKRSKDLSYLEI